jgi:protein SCO1/2
MMILSAALLGVILTLLAFRVIWTRPQPLPVLGDVADFTLTNQDGQVTTLASLSNHVWVADIIFTRCAGPCPIMTAQMKSLQDALPADSAAKLVTLTTDPVFDTPAILKRYGDRFGADFHRWTFLTGTKKEIAGLAGGGLKLSAVPISAADQADAADLFIHSTIFVIIGKHSKLRAIFETEGPGTTWSKVQPRIIATVNQLEEES